MYALVRARHSLDPGDLLRILLRDCARPADPRSLSIKAIDPCLIVGSIRSPLVRVCCPGGSCGQENKVAFLLCSTLNVT